MKHRTNLLLLIVFCLFGSGIPHVCAEVENPGRGLPNIITIILDDLSTGYFGCYGGRTPTPETDRLAESGVLFERAYAHAPLCNPSRYTLLTGLYPGRARSVIEGVPEDAPYRVNFNADLSTEEPSVARDLKAAGYRTAYIGKWHTGWGFQEDLTPFAAIDFNRPEDVATLEREYALRIERIRELTGFDVVASLVPGNLDRMARDGHPLGVHNPEWQTHAALDFIAEAAPTGSPFFLHLAYTPPHTPDNLDMLGDEGLFTHAGKLEAPLPLHAKRKTVRARLEAAGIETEGPIASVNAGTLIIDDQIGAILDQLDKLGIAGNTLVIVTADHSIFGKGSAYEVGLRVPLVMRWPNGLPAGLRIETPVGFSDLVPTFHELAGVERDTDGNSLLPLIAGETKEHPPVYSEIGYFRGLIDGDFQYIAFRLPQERIHAINDGTVETVMDGGSGRTDVFSSLNLRFKPGHFDPDQLYDISVDPFQRHNLAFHPAYRGKLAEMRKKLADITASFERPFPVEIPEGMLTDAYAEAVRQRKLENLAREYYPPRYDAERIYNLNLRDPLE